MHSCPVSRTPASVQERECSCADTQILSFQNSKNLGFPRMFPIPFVAQTHCHRQSASDDLFTTAFHIRLVIGLAT